MGLLQSVLLVDDDNINNFLNARLIKKLKITENVKISLNGEEAIKHLRLETENSRECPSLILLDINMPVMNGFEFLDVMRKENFCEKRPVVIMLTTSTNEKDIDEIKSYPLVSDYINKPLTEEKLSQILKKYFVSEN